MDAIANSHGASAEFNPSANVKADKSGKPRILIVCGADPIFERLNNVLQEAGIFSERVKTMTAGCELARTGRFQVVISAPLLGDGSWRRLQDIASHYNLGFVVVLMASSPELNQSAEALGDAAFDVLDMSHDPLEAVEVTKRALWASYLKGGGPSPDVVIPQKAA